MPLSVLTLTTPVSGTLANSDTRQSHEVPVITGYGYQIVQTGDPRVGLTLSAPAGTGGDPLPRVVEPGPERAWLPPWVATGTVTAALWTNAQGSNMPYRLEMSRVEVPVLTVGTAHAATLVENGNYQWYAVDLTPGQGYVVSIRDPDDSLDFAWASVARLVTDQGRWITSDYASMDLRADYLPVGPVFATGSGNPWTPEGRYYIEVGSIAVETAPRSFDYTVTVTAKPFVPLTAGGLWKDRLDHPGDRDFYTLSLPEAVGETHVVVAQTLGRVYDAAVLTFLVLEGSGANGQFIGAGRGGLEAPLAVSGARAQDLVLTVSSDSRGSEGGYRIFSYTEPDGTANTTGRATTGQIVQGDIDYIYDSDAYAIDLNAGTHTLYFANSEGVFVGSYAHIADEAGRVLARAILVADATSAESYYAVNVQIPVAGRYFLVVTDIAPDATIPQFTPETYELLLAEGTPDLYGTPGSDLLRATAPGQVLHGLEGNDTLVGTAGNDTLAPGFGDAVLFLGGTGTDRIILRPSSLAETQVSGFGGDDVLQLAAQFVTGASNGGTGLRMTETATGLRIGLPDLIPAADPGAAEQGYHHWVELRGNYSDWDVVQTVTGEVAELTLVARTTPLTLIGRAADDRLEGTWHSETLRGDAGHDTLLGNGGDDLIYGQTGNDLLVGGMGNDTLYGGVSTDTLNGGAGDDLLFGGAADVDLRDVIYGGDGNDTADGGAGNDELNGGNGNDMLVGGWARIR